MLKPYFFQTNTGGDVLFDGEHFKGIPRKAITISVWLKLTTTRGIQSIFDTIGSHSAHKDGQYHFEIDDGRVRWFHRNELRQTVFSVVTDDAVLNENEWVLVTATYSAKKNRARVSIYRHKNINSCVFAILVGLSPYSEYFHKIQQNANYIVNRVDGPESIINGVDGPERIVNRVGGPETS